jgi:hypothetical protein
MQESFEFYSVELNSLVIQIITHVLEYLFYCVWNLSKIQRHTYISNEKAREILNWNLENKIIALQTYLCIYSYIYTHVYIYILDHSKQV